MLRFCLLLFKEREYLNKVLQTSFYTLRHQNETQSMKTDDSIKMHVSLKLISESVYLSISNKKRCIEILNKLDLTKLTEEEIEENIIDSLISLHLILEVNLNALFRHLSHNQLLQLSHANIDEIEMIKNIDKIEFISKTTLFIYNSKFNFDNKLNEVENHHKIIEKLKYFSEMRNKIIHGHSIMTIIEEGKSRNSELKKKLNEEFLFKQIECFKSIMEGMRFFLDCLDSSLSLSKRESYKKEFLSDDFLTDTNFYKRMKLKKVVIKPC